MKLNKLLSNLFNYCENFIIKEYVYSYVTFKTKDEIIVYGDYVRIIRFNGTEDEIKIDDILYIKATNKQIKFFMREGVKVIKIS